MVQIKLNLTTLILSGALSAMFVAGCATISEDECLAGSWEDIGYNDGRKGQSRGRLADIAKTCGKFNVAPDRQAYLAGFERGLPLYCTYERGFNNGKSGSSINAECRAGGLNEYLDGHEDGYIRYETTSEHKRLIDDYEATLDALAEVRRRLADEELDADERRRLQKKELRLEDRREDQRIDIRIFERLNDLPRYES